MRTVARIGSLAGVILLVAVCLLFALASVLSAATPLRVLPVLTGSMSPTIPAHSMVFATSVSPRSVKVGDVVVFLPPAEFSNGLPVMHRVHSLDQSRLTMRTKGDANPVADPWTVDLHNARLYLVRGTVPKLGQAISVLRPGGSQGSTLLWLGITLLIGSAVSATKRSRTVPAHAR
jgi:signal peptidase